MVTHKTGQSPLVAWSRASLSFKLFLKKYKLDNELASRNLIKKNQDGDSYVIVSVLEVSEDRKPVTSLLF